MIEFSEIIKNQNVLHIPIYSMFERDTHKLNLTSDGNVNRYLTTYYLNKTYQTLIIFTPELSNTINSDKYKRYLEDIAKSNFDPSIVPIEEIKDSALYQRGDEFAEKVYPFTKDSFSSMIIFEGQGLGKKLLENKDEDKKLVYWCPVCATNKKTRSFLTKDKELNESIFLNKNLDYIIVASIDQVEYLRELGVEENKICLVTKHIDRTLPMFSDYEKNETIISFIKYIESEGKKVVYLPFRLSDEGYKLDEILNTIGTNKDIVLLFPNLNNVSIDELIEGMKKQNKEVHEFTYRNILNSGYKISSSRDTFYTILDNCKNVIIPYFEDLNFINHSTIQELFNENKKPICKVTRNSIELLEAINGKE